MEHTLIATAVSHNWTEAIIRAEIIRLDAITGLHGADLPIRLSRARRSMGSFTSGSRGMYFTFSQYYMSDENFPESEKLDTIRHEYAHYMNYARKTGSGHDAAWKKCCLEVGAYPERCVSTQRIEMAREKQQNDAVRNKTYDAYHAGQTVVHPRFGAGLIVRICGAGVNRNLEVDFHDHGVKKMGFDWVLKHCLIQNAG